MKLFFGRRLPLIGNVAVLIVCAVFFVTPLALNGSRNALERLENNVKDWLPADFEETADLQWASEHFVGDQGFILLTWEGCTAEDERFKLFVKKLRSELAPEAPASAARSAAAHSAAAPTAAEQVSGGEELTVAEEATGAEQATGAEEPTDEQDREEVAGRELERARTFGDQLGLFFAGSFHENWGGQQEKWLQGKDDQWYYVTPEGALYRWRSSGGGLARLWSKISRSRTPPLNGELVATFGAPTTASNQNDFYADPRKFTARVLRTMSTGPEVLARLTGLLRPIGKDLSDEEKDAEARRRALESITGILYGPDGKQTCILVTLSEAGARDMRNVIGRGLLGKPRGKLVELAVESGIGAPPTPAVTPWTVADPVRGPVLRMGGPPVDNVAIDEEGQISLVRLIGLSIVVGLGLAYASFRSVSVSLAVFLVGGISAVVSVGIVYWSGSSVDAILMSMPSLVYLLGISGAIHMVNYYRETVRDGRLLGGPERALAHSWWPCTLAAVTTALGLISLFGSSIIPIQKFGVFSAIGVLATLALLFGFLPAMLQLFPPGYHNQHSPILTRSFGHRIETLWDRYGRWVVRRQVWVNAMCWMMLVGLSVGLVWVHTSVKLINLFHSESKIIEDYTWLEKNVGKLVPMELVLHVSPEARVPTQTEIADLPTSTNARAVDPPATNARAVDLPLTDLRAVDPPVANLRAVDTAVAAGANADAVVHDAAFRLSLVERVELVSMIEGSIRSAFGNDGRQVLGNTMSAATFVADIPKPTASTARRVAERRLERSYAQLLSEDYLKIDRQDQSELWRVSLRLAALNDVDYGDFVAELKKAVEPILTACRVRESVLRRIDGARNGAGFSDSKVLVLGLDRPESVDSATAGRPTSAAPGAGSAAVADNLELGSQSPGIDVLQTSVFARTLDSLFQAKGYRSTARAKNLVQWIGPKASAQITDWSEFVGRFDCVVLGSDLPGVESQLIQDHARSLVDARDHRFDPLRSKTAKQLNDPIRLTYTGVVPLVYKAQRTLLTSLISSIFGAGAMISAAMMILLGNWRRPRRLIGLVNVRGGLVSMLPNVLPVVMIFGAMGYLGIVVDIGSMMTASLALGVAVDGTIHYLTWYRKAIDDGMSTEDAIAHALRRCGTAMVQTTVISGIGLSIFAFSTFTPTQRFGIMMLALLVAALFSDLVMLPALLAGPLGKYFARPRSGRSPEPVGLEVDLPNAIAAPHVIAISERVEASEIGQKRSRHPAAARRKRRP